MMTKISTNRSILNFDTEFIDLTSKEIDQIRKAAAGAAKKLGIRVKTTKDAYPRVSAMATIKAPYNTSKTDDGVDIVITDVYVHVFKAKHISEVPVSDDVHFVMQYGCHYTGSIWNTENDGMWSSKRTTMNGCQQSYHVGNGLGDLDFEIVFQDYLDFLSKNNFAIPSKKVTKNS